MTGDDLVQLAMGPFWIGLACGLTIAIFTGLVFFALELVRGLWGSGGRV